MLNKIIYTIRSKVNNVEFSLLKKGANRFGYNLVKEAPPLDAEIVIENVFKTAHKKSALLSYIIYPFLDKIQNNHSNNRECYNIAEILNELAYNVDVINWNNNSFLPAKNYDLVIDNHNNLERLSPYLNENTLKIFHATNAHWMYQNHVEYGRYYDHFLKTGKAIIPPRLMLPGNSAEYADVISMFGNEFTKSTYGKYESKVHHLPMSVTTTPEIITDRNYTLAKSKFLWLNSHGALLKGLDIVIDTFKMLPHLDLYICGDFETSTQFEKDLDSQLSNARNINFVGWVDTDGKDFKNITRDCAWVVGTSFSEGGGGSILNCMAKGLIPVVSRTSSLTLPDNTGFYLEKNDATTLAGLISNVAVLPDAKLKEMSHNAYNFVASNHTIENFRNKYKAFLVNALAKQNLK